MKPALLLVDLQQDFLRAPDLQPPAGDLLAAARRLLEGFRERGLPVLWVRTSVHRDPDDRPPHWRAAGRWACVAGTPGHAFAVPLAPREGEPVIDKRFYSGFSTGRLDAALAACGAPDTLVVAGVHAHACVQATVLDAYARGHAVWLADEAVGSDEPLLAAGALRWLEARVARRLSVEAVLQGLGRAAPGEAPHEHRDPCDGRRVLFRVPECAADALEGVLAAAREAGRDWSRRPATARAELLEALAADLEAGAHELVEALVRDVAKPRREARDELARATALLRSVAARAGEAGLRSLPDGSLARRAPLGVVALITSFNNPLAIPVGKLAPALLFGNAVAWKPSPAGQALAEGVLSRWAGRLPAGLVGLVSGGHVAAERLCDHPAVDAVSLTGSEGAGFAVAARCARRGLPLQAELGGNNGAIVWDDADLDAATGALARGAFGGAGQRCTANRRVIVADAVHDALLSRLQHATAALVIGHPDDEATDVGPLISLAARRRVEAQLQAARAAGCRLVTPHAALPAALAEHGAWVRPTLVVGAEPRSPIVQQESFGPVLVLQRARDFDEALALLDGVRQGLAAALFSPDPERRRRFANSARAGILRFDAATAGAGVEAPFGGWKASGRGPPEHGPADVEFHTRWQALDADPDGGSGHD